MDENPTRRRRDANGISYCVPFLRVYKIPTFNKLDLGPEDRIAALEAVCDEIAEIVKLLVV